MRDDTALWDTPRDPAAPINLGPAKLTPVHLARQTCGDRALEADVLGMLSRQLDTLLRRIDGARDEERQQIAHALKGTARNVGAFRLADSAERYESAPRDATALAQLRLEAEAAASFARSLIE